MFQKKISLSNAPKLSEVTPNDAPAPIRLAEVVTAPELPALFVADLHLTDERPQTAAAFFDFLSGPVRQAGSVFILGDLFEYWAGDDDTGSAFNRSVCEALRVATVAGVAVYFMTGNRDLLAGQGFAHASGVQLLADVVSVRFGTRTLLLSHGDGLCTDDRDYQAFRLQVRNREWQAGFLTQPLDARRNFIEKVREQSETAKSGKRAEIMDVSADAVAALLRSHGYPTLIHGHTHRPARHTYLIDGHRCERHVLPDWRGHAVWLAFDGAEFSVRSTAPSPPAPFPQAGEGSSE
ncbi:MAG: UDP-2,3-diacylglucosamine diphosphatase [Betaproteobacteria bacterium]|nr:UDP-2,3-diacylglucosamine diphosphatase [Betaproteobacteria bacterium]